MTRHARALLVRLVTTVLTVAGVGLVTITTTPSAQAAPGDVGYADFKYGSGLTGDFIDPDNSPTASKPQSKLWFAQDRWWGVLQVPNTTTTTIHSFDDATNKWTNTGVVVDSRSTPTQADTLWDGTKLYVVSAGRDGSASGIRVTRYAYDTAQAKYVTDGLVTGALNAGGVEAAVIAKDTTGRLWVAYTASNGVAGQRNVRVLVSNPQQTTFGPVFTPPVEGTAVTADDIATVVAHNGSISVVWSNQSADTADPASSTAVYAARHPDSAPPTEQWVAAEKVFSGHNAADDHITLAGVEGNASGSVFMVIKEALDNEPTPNSEGLVRLLVLRPSGVWENYVHSTVGDDMTRPIILLEPSKGLLHVFATSPVEGGVVYRKTTSMANPSFATGKGEPFIKLAAHSFVNNATSMKQNVTAASGVLVLASDQRTGTYVHNYVPGVAPTSNFSFTPTTSAPAPLEVTFTDLSTKAPNKWLWDFGDGTPTSTVQNPKHTYAKQGTYTVKLTASNTVGTGDTKTATITVNVPAPVASFTHTPTSGPAPLAVKFTDTSTGPPSEWAWSFGDGGTSTAQSPSYTFTKPGTYTVSLTAKNVSGTSTKTATVTVGVSVPVASFTYTPTTGVAPLAMKFTDTSTGPPSSWAWDFGDTTKSTEQHPTHTFATAGTYTVSLTSRNASGTSTKTATVTVAPVPPPVVPVVALDGPTAALTMTSYVDVAWHSTTDPVTVRGYDVEVRSIGSRRGSEWETTVLADQKGAGLRMPVRAGSTYCLRVRGTNVAGVAGAWSAVRCTAVPLDDRSLSRSGDWRRASSGKYFMGTALMSRDRGAAVSSTVTGKEVFLVIARRAGGGKVKVFEGKRLVKKVSLNAKTAQNSQVVKIASHTKVVTAKYRIVVVTQGKPVIVDGIAATR